MATKWSGWLQQKIAELVLHKTASQSTLNAANLPDGEIDRKGYGEGSKCVSLLKVERKKKRKVSVARLLKPKCLSALAIFQVESLLVSVFEAISTDTS